MAAIAWDRGREQVERRESFRLVAPPPAGRRPSAAIYRRRRLVALLVGLALVAAALLALAGLARASATAGATSAPLGGAREVVAEPGDSYWSLAAELHDGGDIRSVVDALVDANGGGELRPGDRIVLPS